MEVHAISEANEAETNEEEESEDEGEGRVCDRTKTASAKAGGAGGGQGCARAALQATAAGGHGLFLCEKSVKIHRLENLFKTHLRGFSLSARQRSAQQMLCELIAMAVVGAEPLPNFVFMLADDM
jgi:hypothetical protein